jgi:hypothetical protein
MADVDRTWPARFHLKMTDVTQHDYSVSCPIMLQAKPFV